MRSVSKTEARLPKKELMAMKISMRPINKRIRATLQKFARLGLLESHAKTINMMRFTIGIHERMKKMNQSSIVTVGLKLESIVAC